MDADSTRRALTQIQEHINSPNYVYAVGYANEKVHSGTLAYAVRRFGSPLLASLWNRYSKRKIKPTQVEGLKIRREVRTGKGSVVDMVATFTVSHVRHHVVCEFKVDGFGDFGDHSKQCGSIQTNWSAHPDHKGDASLFLLVTVGDSRFAGETWNSPRFSGLPKDFEWVDIESLLGLLRPWVGDPLIRCYVSALEDEINREAVAPTLSDPENMAPLTGFRRYGWYYAWYANVRRRLSAPEEWSIYSGKNNPVMCWNPAWGGRYPRDFSGKLEDLGSLYCEFNWDSFRLKVSWEENADRTTLYTVLEEVRQALAPLGLSKAGRRTMSSSTTSFAEKRWDDLRNVDKVATWVNTFVPEEFLKMVSRTRSHLKKKQGRPGIR